MRIKFLLKIIGVLVLLSIIIWSSDYFINNFRTVDVIGDIKISTSTDSDNLNNYPSDDMSRGQDGSSGYDNSSSENNTIPANPVSGPSDIIGKKWSWIKTDLLDGTSVQAPAGDRFVLTLESNGNVSSRTDCNSIGGNYVIDGEVLSFGPFVQTMMYCEGSKEVEYVRQLSLTGSYQVRGDMLILNLNRDFGVMYFKKI